MATTRYYDPASGTWKTDQPTGGGGSTPSGQIEIAQVNNLGARLLAINGAIAQAVIKPTGGADGQGLAKSGDVMVWATFATAADLATRARLDSNGNVVTLATGTGKVLATQEFVDQRIADNGGGGSVPADLQTKLDAKADKTQLGNVPYSIVVLAGSSAPAQRPTEAGSRPVDVRGGAGAPTWLDRSRGDLWFGMPS